MPSNEEWTRKDGTISRYEYKVIKEQPDLCPWLPLPRQNEARRSIYIIQVIGSGLLLLCIEDSAYNISRAIKINDRNKIRKVLMNFHVLLLLSPFCAPVRVGTWFKQTPEAHWG